MRSRRGVERAPASLLLPPHREHFVQLTAQLSTMIGFGAPAATLVAEILDRRRGVAMRMSPATRLAMQFAKVEWHRRGGESSERQRRDVLGIVRAQRGNLDRAFLREWAAMLGVADLLERVYISST